MMDQLRERISQIKKGDDIGFSSKIEYADEFEYKDPVDGSVSSNQVF